MRISPKLRMKSIPAGKYIIKTYSKARYTNNMRFAQIPDLISEEKKASIVKLNKDKCKQTYLIERKSSKFTRGTLINDCDGVWIPDNLIAKIYPEDIARVQYPEYFL